jgi:hypothetical protein
MSNQDTRISLLKNRSLRVLLGAALAAAAGVLIFSMTAIARHAHRTDFAVLSGRLNPHGARTAALTSPAGGALAGEFNGQAVYARSVASGPLGEEICLEALSTAVPSHPVTSGCSPRESAEAHGIVLMDLPSATLPTTAVFALVPNSVGSVRFDLAAGGSRTVATANNVAAAEGADIESVHYSIGGAEKSILVPRGAPPTAPAN